MEALPDGGKLSPGEGASGVGEIESREPAHCSVDENNVILGNPLPAPLRIAGQPIKRKIVSFSSATTKKLGPSFATWASHA